LFILDYACARSTSVRIAIFLHFNCTCSGLIHLLPKFHGLASEDPHKHLKEFHVVCSTMRSQGIPEDYIKMKAFSFSLDGVAKVWLYLQPVMFTTLGEDEENVPREVLPDIQNNGHLEGDLWNLATFRGNYFYEGLLMIDQYMIDVASGGALMDKTPAATQHLISNMADNTQYRHLKGSKRAKSVPLSFSNRAVLAKRFEIDEDLLKLFRKVEINIPLLDAIKQIPKYAKFLKELCIHRRKKMNGIVETGGVVLSLVQHEDTKCPNLHIFAVPCTISSRTFIDAMLDLGASLNVMPASIYNLLNLGDLELTWMEIQLANRSVVQPLGVLADVLIPVNELIFPTDFYVLDMKDEASGERSTLILGLSFFMTAKTKIDIHAKTISMEFGDTYMKFNIIEALKHPAEDHSIFSIGTIDGLMEEYFRLGTGHASLADFEPAQIVPHSQQEARSDSSLKEFQQTEAESDFKHPSLLSDRVSQSTPSTQEKYVSPQPQTTELKSLPEHLKEQEEKLLEVLKKNKKAISWILASLPGINPSICMHKILLEEDVRPDRQQQRRLNPTPLIVIKKEVTKLLEAGIIYPISDNQWVSLVQVVPKKSGMTVIKNRQDEMVLLNQATYKDHFLLLFVDQVLYADTYNTRGSTQDYLHMSIRNVRIYKDVVRTLQRSEHFPEMHDQHLLGPFGGLHGVVVDNFTVYVKSFQACLDNLSRVYDSNLILNFEKCRFMVTKGIILGHLVSARGIKVDKAKINAISSLPNPSSIREVHSFLSHVGDSLKISARSPYLCLRHRLRLRLVLCGCILGAEEKTHVRAHPPSTKLGTSVRANV
ncbi:Retrovirus-related Pol polyprotein from transposon opus, partial [Mucuna pruriens]